MGFVVKAVSKFIKKNKVVSAILLGGVFGLSISGSKSKKSSKAASSNLNKTLDPEAYRKIAFGKIAAPLDVRFWEVWGTSGTNYDEVTAVACHRINAFKELYFENYVAIDENGNVQAKYSGILTRAIKLGAVGQTALNVGSQMQWNSQSTFDGVAHMVLKWIPDEKRLPNGIPDRCTQVIEGACLYDPRRDGTVVGGSGPHRVNDQSTWSYSTLDSNGQPIGRNNALQALWYLLGWRVQNPVTGEMVLVAGRGVDPQDINMSTFIVGANNCELAAYYTDMTLSTENDHVSNEDTITCNGLIGRLIDPGGLWSYYANVDDTANIAVELTDADVTQNGNLNWNEYKGISEQYNQVRGKFIYSAVPVLYQPYPYPMVRDANYEAILGVKRSKPQDFEQVLDITLAQRLARLLLNQGQYQGELEANFNYRMLKAQAYSVVRYTSERFGWTKLFRVWRHEISSENGVSATLKEIHSSIWSAGTVVQPTAPGLGNPYDVLQEISVSGLAASTNSIESENGDIVDSLNVVWTLPKINVKFSEVRYKIEADLKWQTSPTINRDVNNVVIQPVFSETNYKIAVRHISIHDIAGPWIEVLIVSGATGNINNAAIELAGTTANASGIVGKISLVTQTNGVLPISQANEDTKNSNVDANTNLFLEKMNLGITRGVYSDLNRLINPFGNYGNHGWLGNWLNGEAVNATLYEPTGGRFIAYAPNNLSGFFKQIVPVYAGVSVSSQATMFIINRTAGSVYFNVQFYNSAGAVIPAPDGGQGTTGYLDWRAPGLVAPAGAVTAEFVVGAFNLTSAFAVLSACKFEFASTCSTVVKDDISGRLSDADQIVDGSLGKVGRLGIITEFGVASDFEGSTDWARFGRSTDTLLNIDDFGRLINARDGLPINGSIGTASATLNPSYPLSSSSSSSITVSACVATFAGGQTISMAAGSVSTGLIAATSYAVFWDRTLSVWVATNNPLSLFFTSISRYVFIGWQSTQNVTGGYPVPDEPPDGGGGGWDLR